ncbi:MAG TPA: SPASM domain-containing protein, partial [Methanosarcinales archaeon]|nr:SPASM domain-containing protein [Methanosarcinales archaeon]
EDLARSDAWKLMHQFKEYVDQECAECAYIKFCRGGCPYNAMAPTAGEIKGVDPHCTAYKMIFKEISDRVNSELLGSSGMAMPAIQSEPGKGTKPGIMSLMFKRS